MSILVRRIRETSTGELRIIYRFFDTKKLRHYFAGLLQDIEDELARRGEVP